ncbi:hypothetical protein NHX12_033736 [Muraenolepis orangiensis]|uniref:Laminin G domain-containing protein n=1 Tax=Muraenolepis orangiensis TaxID=630683 RepID=A0A9Q0E6J5_9TELE|nr:hypothetical protein NHX12_033736 [Muraenolepis orangiensis]
MSKQAFPGNSNADSMVQYKLQQRVVAHYVRLVPVDWWTSGRIGLRLEMYGCPYISDVAGFDGRSLLLYTLSPELSRPPGLSVSFQFKTLRNSGTRLHAQAPSGHGLAWREAGCCSISLLQLQCILGKMLFMDSLNEDGFKDQSSQQQVALGSLLDDQHWHRVKVEVSKAHLNITVDSNTQRTPVPTQLSLGLIQQLSVGAALSPQRSALSENFQGCVENLFYNDLNLIDLAVQKDRQVDMTGNITFSCPEPQSVSATFAGSQSFLRLSGGVAVAGSPEVMSAGLHFRTWNAAGLLLMFRLPPGAGAEPGEYLRVINSLRCSVKSADSNTRWSSPRSVAVRGICLVADSSTSLQLSSELDPEMAVLASKGFTGCLSGVLFNSVSLLKAALLHPDTSPVSVIGPLAWSSCGASSPARPYTEETTHSLSDQSGSAGPGQPLVDAMRSESALIGGTVQASSSNNYNLYGHINPLH